MSGHLAVDSLRYDRSGNVTFGWQPYANEWNQEPKIDQASFYDASEQVRFVDARTAVGGDVTVTLDEFRYDALGRRVLVVSTRACEGFGYLTDECNLSLVRRIVWDGAQELAEVQTPLADPSQTP